MKVMIHGFYGAGNAGDDAILHAMIHTIRRINTNAEIVVIVRSPNIPAYYGTHRIKTITGFDHASIYREMKTSQILLVGGGGLFQDYNEYKPYELFKNQNGAMNYYLTPILLAKMLRVKTMLYAVGIGPLQQEDSKNTMRWISEIVDAITVRDQHSLELMRSLGIHNTILTADPAIPLGTENIPAIFADILPTQTKIGINFRKWSYEPIKSQHAIDTVIGVLQVLRKQQEIVNIIFPFNSLPSERKLAGTLATQFQGGTKIVPYDMSPTKYKAICQNLDLMIGMRLHANIFAIGAGIPSIGISYDSKVKNFFHECGLEELCLNLEEVTSQKLLGLIHMVWNNQAYWKKRIETARNRLIKREQMNQTVLSKLLN